MEREFSLVSMAAEHMDQVAEIEKQCFSTPWSRNMLAGELENLNAAYIVAEQEEQVLGYAGVHVIMDEGYITNVAVAPALRRMGIGSALLRTFRRFAEQNALRFLTLEVRESNREAIGLYTSCGYAEAGRRRNYYEHPAEDAVLMTLWLKEEEK